MKVSITQKITTKTECEATSISIELKVRDEFFAVLKNSNGEDLADYEGYVPSFFPGNHHGDYVSLDIDLETGRILNWKKPTKLDIEKLFDGTF